MKVVKRLAVANTLKVAPAMKQRAAALIVVRNRVNRNMKNFPASIWSPSHQHCSHSLFNPVTRYLYIKCIHFTFFLLRDIIRMKDLMWTAICWFITLQTAQLPTKSFPPPLDIWRIYFPTTMLLKVFAQRNSVSHFFDGRGEKPENSVVWVFEPPFGDCE